MRSIGSSSAERRPRASRRPLVHRATALVLSWVFTATTFWASAPPLAFAAPPPTEPRPATIPGFPDSLSQGQAQTRTSTAPRGSDRGGRPGTPPTVGAAVRPICECVVEHGPGRFTAYFGYQNDNAAAVTIPVGSGNALNRPVPGRPPTVFQPGRTPGHAGAPFRVDFDGDAVSWTVKGPDGRPWSATASRHSPRCGPPEWTPGPNPPGPACESVFFGPRRFTRTRGEPDVFEETIEVPASVAPPHVLRLQNGEPDGRNRVSSGWVALNGEDVVRPQDLNPRVQGFHREVTLTPKTELRVTLASAPGSFLQLSLCGKRPDHTPPTLAVVAAGARLVRRGPGGAGAARVRRRGERDRAGVGDGDHRRHGTLAGGLDGDGDRGRGAARAAGGRGGARAGGERPGPRGERGDREILLHRGYAPARGDARLSRRRQLPQDLASDDERDGRGRRPAGERALPARGGRGPGHARRDGLHLRAAARRRGERGPGRGARPPLPRRHERAAHVAPRHQAAGDRLHGPGAGEPGRRGRRWTCGAR